MGHTPRIPHVFRLFDRSITNKPEKEIKREKPRVPLVIGPEIFWKDSRWNQLDSIMRKKASKKGGGAG